MICKSPCRLDYRNWINKAAAKRMQELNHFTNPLMLTICILTPNKLAKSSGIIKKQYSSQTISQKSLTLELSILTNLFTTQSQVKWTFRTLWKKKNSDKANMRREYWEGSAIQGSKSKEMEIRMKKLTTFVTRMQRLGGWRDRKVWWHYMTMNWRKSIDI